MDHVRSLYQLAVLASFRPEPDELARALALQVLGDYRVAHVNLRTVDGLGRCATVGSFGPSPDFGDLGLMGFHQLPLESLLVGKPIALFADHLLKAEKRQSQLGADYLLLLPLMSRSVLVGAAIIGTGLHPEPETSPEFWATISVGCGMLLTPRFQHGGPAQAGAPSLSSRQRRILELVAEGMTNQQIGNRLGYSESTIGHDLVAAYERLGVRNREDAVRTLGLVSAGALSS